MSAVGGLGDISVDAPSAKNCLPRVFARSVFVIHFLGRSAFYEAHCGLEKVHMSWGHDEYLYHVVKDYLPQEGAYIIRYHSFYPAHREKEYGYLMDAEDERLMGWVKEFNKYDLYSKCEEAMDTEVLKPYYEELVREFFPDELQW
ncbi:MAG: hypothetical protein H7A36_06950 [Chlamydiales bacterium]|nr:hypothetical protein [Chlamydiales bacterium]